MIQGEFSHRCIPHHTEIIGLIRERGINNLKQRTDDQKRKNGNKENGDDKISPVTEFCEIIPEIHRCYRLTVILSEHGLPIQNKTVYFNTGLAFSR